MSGLGQFRTGNQYDENAKRYAFKDRDHVLRIQQKMIDAGVLQGKADGAWGHQSMAAYERWKKKGFNKYGKIQRLRTLQAKVASTNRLQQKSTKKPQSLWDKASYVWAGDKDSETNAAGRLVETVFGTDKNSGWGTAAEMASYFTPAGNFLSANEAFQNARQGRWGDAALNGLFALPVIGNVGKLMKISAKLGKSARLANMGNKTINASKAIGKVSDPAMKVYGLYGLGSMGAAGINAGRDIYKATGDLSNSAAKIRNQYNSEDLTEEGREFANINGRWDAAKYLWNHHNDEEEV